MLAGTALAQPLQDYREPLDPKPDERAEKAQVAPFNGEPVEVLHSGRGLALIGNESHTLRLSVESLRPIEPTHMRKLLTSNASLNEIRAALDTVEGEAKFDGTIKLDEKIYPLVDIKIIQSGENSSTLDANVVEPAFGAAVSNEMTIVGHITLSIVSSGMDCVANGELIINRGPQAGSYLVFLNMQPPLQNTFMKGE
ncbi:MAG: hypothetical protein ACYDHX_13055 [Methanothrix sp.]